MAVIREVDEGSFASLVFAVCPPEGHDLQQALDISLKYLREYPERGDRPAAQSIMASLSEAWSCHAD
jgi:Rap1a immunity proteins